MSTRILCLTIAVLILSACGTAQGTSPGEAEMAAEYPTCSIAALRALPDVRLTAVREEAAPVPHCKVVGIIGTETHFELLLPENWNGEFVMDGGGGFVGSVMNRSLIFGSLQKGYATVGTDTGHAMHPLNASWA